MNTINKQAILDRLPYVQYTTDISGCWQALEQSVSKLAGKQCSELLSSGTPGRAFTAWWQSCCELFVARQVVISNINFKGDDDNHEEYVEIFNNGPMIVDVSGWRLNAGNDGQDVVIPLDTLMHPQTSIRIDTAGRSELSFNRKHSVWNNKGDEGLLFDNAGNLISSWLYGVKAHAGVMISHIQFDGAIKGSEADEYAEICNISNSWIDLSDWQLNAGDKQDFVFPRGATLCPGEKVRVYTNMLEPSTGGFSFQSKRAIWNNKGDTGKLTDYQNKLVSEYSYGAQANVGC